MAKTKKQEAVEQAAQENVKQYVGDAFSNTKEFSGQTVFTYNLSLSKASIDKMKEGNIILHVTPNKEQPEGLDSTKCSVYVRQDENRLSSKLDIYSDCVLYTKKADLQRCPVKSLNNGNEYYQLLAAPKKAESCKYNQDLAMYYTTKDKDGELSRTFIGNGSTINHTRFNVSKTDMTPEGMQQAIKSNWVVKVQAMIDKGISKEMIEAIKGKTVKSKMYDTLKNYSDRFEVKKEEKEVAKKATNKLNV